MMTDEGRSLTFQRFTSWPKVSNVVIRLDAGDTLKDAVDVLRQHVGDGWRFYQIADAWPDDKAAFDAIKNPPKPKPIPAPKPAIVADPQAAEIKAIAAAFVADDKPILGREQVEAGPFIDDAGHDYGDLFAHLDSYTRRLVRAAIESEDRRMGKFGTAEMVGRRGNARRRRRYSCRVPRERITLAKVNFGG